MWMIKVLIRGYQICISPYMRRTCRYLPSCSEYAYQSIERFGIIQGCWLALKRIARCHPFAGFGLDPVPEITNPEIFNKVTNGEQE